MTDREAKRRAHRDVPAGVMALACAEEEDVATREALSEVCTHQPDPREGQAGPAGWRTGP